MTSKDIRIRRRTIAKGAAWAVPAVVIAAAPAAHAATSGDVVCIPSEEICGEALGSACKHPGNPTWYHFTFCFTNTGDADATVSFTEMVINSITAPQILPASVVVPADGAKHCFYVDGGLFGDSAQGTGTLTFEVNGLSADIPIFVDDLPPCGTGADPGDNPGANPVAPFGHNPAGP